MFLEFFTRFQRGPAETIKAWLSGLKQTARERLPVSYEVLALFASYVCFVGVLDWFAQRHFLHQTIDLYLQWTMGFRPEKATYNVSFIAYIAAILGLLGGVVLHFTLQQWPEFKKFALGINERIWGKVFGLSLLLMYFSPFDLAYVCFVIAAVGFALRLWLQGVPASTAAMPSTGQRAAHYLLLVGLIALSCGMAFKATLPITLTNDYIEVNDKIVVPGTNPAVTLTRDEAVQCLLNHEYNMDRDLLEEKPSEDGDDLSAAATNGTKKSSKMARSPTRSTKQNSNDVGPANTVCPYGLSQQQVDLMTPVLHETGGWQSQAGRLLYHHSYMYVPIAHMLKFGALSPIPSLYGFGNTLFYAKLMGDKPVTLTNYFSMYPIAQFIGMLVIALAVWMVTRNIWSPLAAAAAVLIPLFTIGYENIQVAPGFSPLRYVGLALQVASIAYLYRGQATLHLIVFWAAMAFSIIWNKEFAVLGCVGQFFALMLPALRISIPEKISAVIISLCMIAGLFVFLGHLSDGFLETIQVGIFSIAMPPLAAEQFAKMCGNVVIGIIIAVAASLRFEGAERSLRLAIIPILCLLMIKYVYNSSEAHLSYVMAFIAPFSLVFFDWNRQTVTPYLKNFNEQQRRQIAMFALSSLVLICAIMANHYQGKATLRRGMLVDMFEKNVWSGLDETINITTPAEPIETRMKALREVVTNDDKVIILSPFDHLMSFYGNPKSYCGHFEHLTNLVTYKDINSVIECGRSNPNTLIVYDEAVKDKCPASWEGYVEKKSCIVKKRLIASTQTIMDALAPQMVLVKKIGPLSFYRHAAAKPTK